MLNEPVIASSDSNCADDDTAGSTIPYNSVPAIIISILAWAIVYQMVSVLFNWKSPEYRCRILSFVHGCVSAFIGINQCFLIDTPFRHPEWRTTKSQRFLMLSSLGYFVHDLIWMLIYDRRSKLMLAHHFYSAWALYRMLYKDNSGAQTTCALGCMEISNPLLQIRWFLRSEGFHHTAVFTSAEITFVIVFFLVRILLGTYFLTVIVRQPKNEWEFKVLAAVIYIMSWMFMVNIVRYLTPRNREPRKSE